MSTRHFVVANGIRIRYVQHGAGPPVVFLHGFPDFSYSWRHQFPALGSAGFRCIAPDLRGYNETEKPRRVRDYALPQLVRDVEQLIAQVAGGAAHVVGHDWGGIIAWAFATRVRGLGDRSLQRPPAAPERIDYERLLKDTRSRAGK